jgi:hypothetical protein
MNDYSKRLRYRLEGLLRDDLTYEVSEKPSVVRERLLMARKSFVMGYQKALNASKKELPLLLIDWTGNRRGFALEGAAMAVTLIDELDKTKQDLLTALLSGREDNERILSAIGIGWASARLRQPVQWLPLGEFANHELLAIIDGYGFHQGLFSRPLPKGSSFLKLTADQHVAYYNGLGRSIWFAQNGSIANIHEAISKYPERDRKALWCGLGIACAFTDNIDQLGSLMDNSHNYKSDVYQGAQRGTTLLSSLMANNKSMNKNLIT